MNIAAAYGGREEITDALRQIVSAVESGTITIQDIDEQLVQSYLLLQDEPDMVIRTGNEYRTSNFFPWQTHYSEWFFLECLWPEFTEEHLDECIEEFSKRSRRFGK